MQSKDGREGKASRDSERSQDRKLRKIYGITGGIGSGKSYVARILAENLGLLYIDTDSLAKEQMKRGGVSFAGVVETFGADRILGEDGEIDRKALSAIVFADGKAREKLNSLTHPNVIGAVKDTIERVRAGECEETCRGVIVESALMIEAGFTDIFDEVIYVRAPIEDRRRRLESERGYDAEKIDRVFASQQTEETYERYATIIIDNPDGTEDAEILRHFR